MCKLTLPLSLLMSFFLSSCTSLGIATDSGMVTIEEKPFCDIKKVDSNCRVEKGKFK